MARANYRDRALVVRTHDFGEADRVIVLLTEHHGIVRAVAKGVRRATSRFGSRLQVLVLLDVLVYPGKNLASIAQADTVAFYGAGVIDDYSRYTCAVAALDCGQAIIGAGESDPVIFGLLVDFLQGLKDSPDPVVDVDGFLLQAMGRAGWLPSLFDCAQCGAPGPHGFFSPQAGGAVCRLCRPVGALTPAPGALRLMWWLAHGRKGKIDALATGLTGKDSHYFTAAAASVHAMTCAHLRFHLERGFSSLEQITATP
ncbi:DNA repair protein RecO [Corynebacterium mendelii]|uniref:DNA repair protein RecO n=1 Tax=Corynebacterium mendelii TaxID=2765362 RepID=A0A939E2G9_9CORY|nr:DNA repair protein RecO [Corynebacterium mendelii]MBN9644237.1 DNA repair protein RecO [Corynebacterium mendelii]